MFSTETSVPEGWGTRWTYAGAEQTWEPHRTDLGSQLWRKNRARGDDHADPAGLFHLGRVAGEEIPGWRRVGRLRIDRASVRSAELSRASSYSPSPLPRRCPINRGPDSGSAL